MNSEQKGSDPFTIVAERSRRRAYRYCLLSCGGALIGTLGLVGDFALIHPLSPNTAPRAALFFGTLVVIVAGWTVAIKCATRAITELLNAHQNRRAARKPLLEGEKLWDSADRSWRLLHRLHGWRPVFWTSTAVLSAAVLFGLLQSPIGQDLLRLFSETPLSAIILIAVVPSFIVDLAGGIARQLFRERKHKEYLKAGYGLDFRYVRRPVEAHLEEFAQLPLFRRGRDWMGQAGHLLIGEVDGVPVRIVTYGYNKSRWLETRIRQTVVIAKLERTSLSFLLYPRDGLNQAGWFQRLDPVKHGILVGLQSIGLKQLRRPPAFASGYRLMADPNEDLYEVLLRPELSKYRYYNPDTIIEAADGWIAVYRPNEVWDPSDCPRRLRNVLDACAIFRQMPKPEEHVQAASGQELLKNGDAIFRAEPAG